MNNKIFHSKFLVIFTLFLFIVLISSDVFPQRTVAAVQDIEQLIREGKQLYEDGEYEAAKNTLLNALTRARAKKDLSEVYFNLSLAFYAVAQNNKTKEMLERLFKIQPERTIDERYYPSGYVEIFNQVRGKEIPVVKGQFGPPEKVKKGGGGIFIIVGLLAAGGGAAALLLSKKSAGEGNGNNGGATTGSIQVNSTPTGASVYLDGSNTGYTTNCTLTSVSAGSHTIKLVKEGYQDYETSVSVTAGQTSSVDATLTAHTITVTSPTSGGICIKGDEVNIAWETDESSGSAGNMRAGSGLNSLSSGSSVASSYQRRRAIRYRRSFLEVRRVRRGLESMGLWQDKEISVSKLSRIKGVSKKSSSSGKEVESVPQRGIDIGTKRNDMRFERINFPRVPKNSYQRQASLSKMRILTITNVKIDLYKGGSLVETIVSSTDNDGSYNWTVDTSLTGGSDYRVRISCATDSGIYGESDEFTIPPDTLCEAVDNCNLEWDTGGDGDGWYYQRSVYYYDNDAAVSCDISDYESVYIETTVQGPRIVSFYWKVSSESYCDYLTFYVDNVEQESISGTVSWQQKSYSISSGTHTLKWEYSKDGSVSSGSDCGWLDKVEVGSTTGSIQVNSTPTGASAYLDGSDTGETTNCTLTNVSAGSHTIKLVKEGYEDYETSVTVTAGETSTVNATLTAHTITVTAPTGSTVWTTGEEVEMTWETSGSSSSQGNLSTSTGLNPLLHPGKENRSYQSLLRTGKDLEGMKSSKDGERILNKSSKSKDISEKLSSSAKDVDSIPQRAKDIVNIDKNKSLGKVKLPAVPGISPQKASSKGKMNILTITNVKIELYKGDDLEQTITSSTTNDGSYTWTVESLEDGSDYKVRISCASEEDIYGESDEFQITSATVSLCEAVDNCDLEWSTGGDADWYGQTYNSYYGGDAAKSGEISHSQQSYIQTTITGGGTLTFYWKVSSESGYDYLEFYIDDVLQTSISGEVDWQQKSYSLSSGSHTVKWKYIKDVNTDNGSDCGWVDKVVLTSLCGAVDNCDLEWSTGGNADWFSQTSVYYYGNDAAESGDISHSQSSYIQTTVEGPKNVTFYWKVSSEESYDYLTFYIDNAQQDRISGTVDWHQESFSVDSGTHTLKWVYSKDGSLDSGSDCGWLDKVEVTTSYEFVTKWGSQGSSSGEFNDPFGVAVYQNGYVYVVEDFNSRVQKFTTDGTYVTKWGSFGSSDNQFIWPEGIGVDSSGYVYVADTERDRVKKYTSDGPFVTKWGSSGSGDSQFNEPKGIAVDSSGYVYVADTSNHRIQKFTSAGTFVTKWGSQGSGDGYFNHPHDIAVDSSGYVYVADTDNERIQKFTSDGTFTTKWGSAGSGNGQFSGPHGIAVDSSGYVYVADTDNDRIQKFTSSGTFVTKWGSYGSGDGEFRDPLGIAVDSSGYVYVADTSNHRIQKFGPASASQGPTVSTFFPGNTHLKNREISEKRSDLAKSPLVNKSKESKAQQKLRNKKTRKNEKRN